MKNLIVYALAMLLTCGAQAQWVSRNFNTGSEMGKIRFADENHGWLVGDSLYRTTDGGESWKALPQLKVNTFFIDSIHGWTADWNSWGSPWIRISHSTDGGYSWIPEADSVRYGISQLFFTDTLHGWYRCWAPGIWASDSTFIYRTTNGGEHWELLTKFPGVSYDIFFSDSLTGWLGGSDMYGSSLLSFEKTIDGGHTWSVIPGLENPYASCVKKICFTDSLNGWLFGCFNSTTMEPYDLMRTRDGGLSWEPRLPLQNAGLWDASFTDSNNGWLIGDEGKIIHTSDGGITWEIQPGGVNYLLQSICMLKSGKGWISGMGPELLHTENGGITSIHELLADQAYVSPNPTRSLIRVNCPMPVIRIEVRNSMGQMVRCNEYKEVIDLTGLAQGIYLINVVGTHSSIIFRVMKI